MGYRQTGGCLLAFLLISCGDDGSSRSGPALEPRPEEQTCLPDLSEGMPARLSDTGCFVDLKTLEPGPDLIPYEVNSALWTDGAFKPRYMVVPSPERISIAENGSWRYPEGSVLIKVFGFEFMAGDPDSRRAVETRFMVRNGGRWDYYTYQWNDEGSEADLLDAAKTIEYTIEGSGGPEVVKYLFPSRVDCTYCHFEGVSEVLGPKTSQLNRNHDYDGLVANQLAAMAEIDLLSKVFGDDEIEPSTEPRMANPQQGEGSLEDRARAYLDANCAHCHRPNAYGDTAQHGLDLRYEVSLEDSGLCEPMRYYEWMGTPRIAPRNPAGSGIIQRFDIDADQIDADQRMPSLGTAIVDPFGTELLSEWIAQLSSCP